MPPLRSFIRSLLGKAPAKPLSADPSDFESNTDFLKEFSVPFKRVVNSGNFNVELDLSQQVLSIKAPARDIEWDYDFNRSDYPLSVDPRLSPTLATNDMSTPLSASVLAQKAKIFDDGLYAAVELATQEGAGQHAGKAKLIASLGSALAAADSSVCQSAQELVLGAADLGDVSVNVPANVRSFVDHAVKSFLADELRSKPIGFYTWSKELSRIFQQDRMLQGELDANGVKAVANALWADPVARATYEKHLRFVSQLTNPFVKPDFRTLLKALDQSVADVSETNVRFLPPSVAHETNLVKKLFGDAPIPDDFVLVDEMIRRIRSGELNLEPSENSGWYDYQTWALEPLVIPERMPEGKRLLLDDEYRTSLLDLFKGLLTLTRETHIKQVEIPECGAAGFGGREEVFIDIDPALTAEPLATFYLRRACGYRYIRNVLEETFGAQAMQELHRVREAGKVQWSLAEELDAIENLFFGAHVTVSRELGLAPDNVPGSKTSENDAAVWFAAWLRNLESDPDLNQDLRAMVPVFYDLQRRKTKVWAFLGWSQRPVTISFAQPPRATVRDLSGAALRHHPKIRWGFLSSYLQHPVTAEFYVDRILDRNEFREVCNSSRRRSEILRRLDASVTSN